MFDLILEITNGFWPMRDAHTLSAITLLPIKVLQLSGESRPTTQPLLIEWLWRWGLRLAVTAAEGTRSSVLQHNEY